MMVPTCARGRDNRPRPSQESTVAKPLAHCKSVQGRWHGAGRPCPSAVVGAASEEEASKRLAKDRFQEEPQADSGSMNGAMKVCTHTEWRRLLLRSIGLPHRSVPSHWCPQEPVQSLAARGFIQRKLPPRTGCRIHDCASGILRRRG